MRLTRTSVPSGRAMNAARGITSVGADCIFSSTLSDVESIQMNGQTKMSESPIRASVATMICQGRRFTETSDDDGVWRADPVPFQPRQMGSVFLCGLVPLLQALVLLASNTHLPSCSR